MMMLIFVPWSSDFNSAMGIGRAAPGRTTLQCHGDISGELPPLMLGKGKCPETV